MNQILEKISKALELANNNSNENEAQNAILAAQRLMAKHHITQEELDDFINEDTNQASEVIEENAENEINNEKWKRNLMIILAKNFRCDTYFHGQKLIIVGENEDILITKRVYLYAKQAILNNFKTTFQEKYENRITDNTFRNKCKKDYAYGFIRGLYEKLEVQKANSEVGLIVVNQNVKEHLSNIKFSGVHRSRKVCVTNSYCYEEGRKKGKNLADIDTQMKGEN